MNELVLPKKFVSVAELVKNKGLVPACSGYYFWSFKNLPLHLLDHEINYVANRPVHYVGIANRGAKSNSGLNGRIFRNHIFGTARNSTLRMSIGALLSDISGFKLRTHCEERKKYWFGVEGERWLSNWIEENGFVGFVGDKVPEIAEKILIPRFLPPLNIRHNSGPSSKQLRLLRQRQQEDARSLPPAFRSPQ